MLGSIEELERDIELFQQNMAASGEMQKLLNQMLGQIKQQNTDFNKQSKSLITRIENLPSVIENANLTSNNRVKTDVGAEIDRALRSFADEQGKYISSLEKIQSEFKDSESRFIERYSETKEAFQKMNASDLYNVSIQLKNEFNKRTTILMICSFVSIIIGIVGILV